MSTGVAKTGGAGATLASESESRRVRVARAVDACRAAKGYGDEITRVELEAWFAITYPTNGGREEIDALNALFFGLKTAFDKALLVEHKMALESKGSRVWRIVLPREQGDFAVRSTAEGIKREIEKGARVIKNTDTSGLTEAEKAKLSFSESRIAGMSALASRSFGSRRLGGGEGAK